jgi:hypothetical protein
MIMEGDYLLKIDLRKAYHSIKMNDKMTKYLKIRWRNQLYEFRALPLGIAAAPRIYNAVMGAAVNYLRKCGVRMAFFVDDILVMGRSKVETEVMGRMVREELENWGFVVNQKKSMEEAKRKVEYLGIALDTEKNVMRVPKKKVVDMKKYVRKMMERGVASARQIAVLVGKMQWMLAIAKRVKEQRTKLGWCLKEMLKEGWDRERVISQQMIETLKELDGMIIKKEEWERQIVEKKEEVVVTTDAGPKGGAARIEVGRETKWRVWKWTKEIREESTNYRELLTFYKVLREEGKLMKGRRVLWITDSRSAEAYVRKTHGRTERLAELSWKVERLLRSKKVILTTKVVLGSEIEQVD